MRILFASHTFDGGPFKVGSHHLAAGLAALGHHVVHISTPVSPLHALGAGSFPDRARLAVRGLRVTSDRLAHLVPAQLLPLTSTRADALAIRSAARPWWGSVTRFLGGEPDVLLIDQPKLLALAALFPRAAVITRATDLPASDREAEAFRRCAVISRGLVATSALVGERLRTWATGVPSLVLRNGVDLEHIESAPARDWSARRGVVYVGALDERFDWEKVAASAELLPTVPFDLWGPATSAPIALPPNVGLRGPLDYALLPRALAGARVGLLPLTAAPSNEGRSPMKLFEYLAGGLRVVASSTATLRGIGCADVSLTTSAAGFASAVRAAHDLLPTGDGAALARSFSWSGRAAALDEFVRSVVPAPEAQAARS